jgi:hypothetical protein
MHKRKLIVSYFIICFNFVFYCFAEDSEFQMYLRLNKTDIQNDEEFVISIL